jgi:periplasmic protein TonB
MAYARANMFYEHERWRKPLALSLGFHVLLGLTIFALGFVMTPSGKSNWGEHGGDDAVEVRLVSAPIPIPKPDAPVENIVANDTKAVTQTPPQTKTTETEDGVTIPGQVIKPKIDKVVTKANVQPHPMPTPETAVPYGDRGPVSGPYGVFTAPNTKGGFSFQDANFGNKYGWYVDVVRRKVQSNWLAYEIDPHINAPHRAYITFDILRDGRPDNIRMEQDSGVPSLNQSAMRAIQRVDTFGPLPEGNKVSVEFWFDYPPK